MRVLMDRIVYPVLDYAAYPVLDKVTDWYHRIVWRLSPAKREEWKRLQ